MDAQKIPHYRRIARQLKQAIERGELAPGSRLPASRVYAQELGVSRATVENAWGELVAQFREQAALMSCSVPTLWQQTLADFIREGHFWRHLKKMRASYAQRRLWLESALRAQGFTVVPQAGGIQMVVRVAGDDRLLAQRARRAGLAVQALSDWRMESRGDGGLIMSFTNLTSAEMANEAVRKLDAALYAKR
ncbi:hypothetical protein CGB73_11060 [Klebsiella sp. 11263]|nr:MULTISPECIES: aminotransferase class I/II-fold pyridoxal phosphate-dependent enzyme [unclassified Klebsiella]MBW5979732.1 hypothetical protein [Klebsiella michiganensis]MBW6009484.1 hypothetical protein [Klebsiella sp. CVUAS 11263]MBW6030366.1 hypothetical protein [Klebsiella sp. CVUAS 11332]